jgi:hypothetical protein
VIIQALRSATRSQIAATTTGADGRYSLSLPNNTSIVLQVEARLERQSPPPTWLVRVLDGNAGTPYTYSDGIPFVLGAAAVTRDIAIPTGINANGVATGARASGPFAILDTIYQSIQTVVAVEPNATFGTLLVDWGSQTDGTFYDSASRRIALLADLTEDTDEFDQHVIAHEFGHYLEHNFSRADSIGGSHVIGQRLDPRVAFGEGWGYAFAAIALGDTIARDSFVDNGTQRSSNLDIELNPTTPATGGGGTGCWCSESSVWSILYDVFDGNADANDSVVLGFGPIWDVLIDQQADTPAFTTIFSFISALKSQSTGQNAQIDTLVGAQNITTTGMDAFATTETSEPFAGVALTPIYTTITRGQTVTLRTIDDGGRYNKAGNRRFLRFDTGASNAPFTVSLSSSNPNNADPDFIIFNAGTPVLFATDPPSGGPQTGTLSNVSPNTTYVIDVHDCANGCSTEQGTPGDYDLTVTLN